MTERKHQTITPALRRAILAHKTSNPAATSTEIAAHFNVDRRRVAEIVKEIVS